MWTQCKHENIIQIGGCNAETQCNYFLLIKCIDVVSKKTPSVWYNSIQAAYTYIVNAYSFHHHLYPFDCIQIKT